MKHLKQDVFVKGGQVFYFKQKRVWIRPPRFRTPDGSRASHDSRRFFLERVLLPIIHFWGFNAREFLSRPGFPQQRPSQIVFWLSPAALGLQPVDQLFS